MIKAKKIKLSQVDVVNQNKLLLTYSHKKSDAMFVCDMEGNDMKMVELPALGDIKEFWSSPNSEKSFIKLEAEKAHKNLSGTYLVDLNTGKYETISLSKDFKN